MSESLRQWDHMVAENEELHQKVAALERYKIAMENHLCPHDLADWLHCGGGHTANSNALYCDVCDEDNDTLHPHGKRVWMEGRIAALELQLAEAQAHSSAPYQQRTNRRCRNGHTPFAFKCEDCAVVALAELRAAEARIAELEAAGTRNEGLEAAAAYMDNAPLDSRSGHVATIRALQRPVVYRGCEHIRRAKPRVVPVARKIVLNSLASIT